MTRHKTTALCDTAGARLRRTGVTSPEVLLRALLSRTPSDDIQTT
jgi:hypothetical protein